MKYWKSGRYGLALSSALALGAIPAFGQDTAANTEAANDDEVVELSPFVVDTSKDVGYVATNSISGTRLNMSIKDVPMNLEVITSKFIQDTGATNLREALRYSSGLVLSSQADAFSETDSDPMTSGANDARGATRTAGDSVTKLRGFTGDSVLQDGFHRTYSADSINIERVEVLRGPSALLYGTGNFGGVINYIVKKPVFDRTMTHFGVSIAQLGNTNSPRVELDYNTPLCSENSWLAKYQPAFRISAAWQQYQDDTEYYDENHWDVNAGFSFKPFERTTVRVNYEAGLKSEYGVGFQNLRNNFGAEGANRDVLWVTDTYDTETGLKTGETEDTRTFRWSGDDTYLKSKFSNLTIDLEQEIMENMIFKFGYSRSTTEFESRQINAFLTAGGALTTETYTSMWTGEEITDRTEDLWSTLTTMNFSDQEGGEGPETIDNAVIQYEWVDVDKSIDRDQLRTELMYKLDLDNWGVHTFIIGGSYERIATTTDTYRPAQTYVETYLDADGNTVTGSTYTVLDRDRYSYKNATDHSAFVYGTQGDGYVDNPQVHWTTENTRTWDLGYYAVYQGQFFNDRLTIVGGARRDRFDSNGVTEYVYANEYAALSDTDDYVYGKANDYSGRTGTDAPTAWSPQFGVSYAITSNFSVFGVYSSGLVPNFYARDGNDEMLDPTEVKNLEVGIKYELFDGKLSGTLSYYHIEREGVAKYLWWAPNPSKSIDSGYDTTAVTSLTCKFTTPAGFYDAIFNSGLDLDTAVATCKEIWPECWWTLIDEIANNCTSGSTGSAYDFAQTDSSGNDITPFSNHFWDYYSTGATTVEESKTMLPCLYLCQTNTENGVLDAEVYYPLVDYGVDDNVDAVLNAILFATGWNGNYGQAVNGMTYLYGDGTTGTANASTGVGAYVPMDDEADGWDCQLTWTPIPEFQLVAGFSHLDRKVTSETYKLVSAKFAPGAEWLKSDYAAGTLDPNLTAYDVYDDINDASTYHAKIPDTGQSADDSPENTFTIWGRYELSHMTDSLKGWAMGLGATWEDNRCWYTGFLGTGNVSYVGSTKTLVQYWTDERITVNGLIEYRTQLFEKYNTRYALNIDNLFDDKEQYGLIYADGRSVRLSMSVDF